MSVALTRPRALVRRGRGTSARRSELLLAGAFLLPAVVVYGYFMVYPFLGSLWLSLTNWDGFSRSPQFIGLANYVELLADERM